jgi:uncharacterized protein
VRVYLDASVLVALVTEDVHSLAADAYFRDASVIMIVSDFAAAEFASAIGLRVRAGEYDVDLGRTHFVELDRWVSSSAEQVEVTASDVQAAAGYLRRLDTTLRTPDALNIAIAMRLSAALATFDRRMANAARQLGAQVAPL